MLRLFVDKSGLGAGDDGSEDVGQAHGCLELTSRGMR